MKISYCNDSINNIVKELDSIQLRISHARDVYDQCIQKKVGNCHIILEDMHQLTTSKIFYENLKENIVLKCYIEKSVENS